MTKSTAKLIYKPDTQSTDEFIVFVNPDEYKKYADGDTSIPIVEVVDSYDIFFSPQGNQGLLGKASDQQLIAVFETKENHKILEIMLKNGVMQHAERIDKNSAPHKNESRGGALSY